MLDRHFLLTTRAASFQRFHQSCESARQFVEVIGKLLRYARVGVSPETDRAGASKEAHRHRPFRV